MNLHVASSLLIQRRQDWLRPHLAWLPENLYRTYLALRK